MECGFYFSRFLWLVVPEIIYILLLFGSWISIMISAMMVITGAVKKKSKRYIIKWGIVLLVALIISLLTMTGKIAPNTAFGG